MYRRITRFLRSDHELLHIQVELRLFLQQSALLMFQIFHLSFLPLFLQQFLKYVELSPK